MGYPKEDLGRSRGGITTKTNLRVSARGLPMRIEITLGQTSDYEGFDIVMADNLPTASVLIADKGYGADRIREKVKAHSGAPVIPMCRNHTVKEPLDTVFYAWRNLLERCFNGLKHIRRLATRYDKTSARYLSFTEIACIRLWLRCL